MNFLELYEELIEVLAENSSAAPQYWSAAELKRYLNRANAELTRRSGLGRMLLPLQPAELGAFYPPTDMLELVKVYYSGKQLDHKSVDFLDAHYGGTDHQQIHSGDGKTYSSNWRTETGIPIHWYFENNKIKLYPCPETALSGATPTIIRGKLVGNILAGATSITLPEPAAIAPPVIVGGKLTGKILVGATSITLAGVIPNDQTRVDLYVDGIYQNKNKWSIPAANVITFIGWSAIVGSSYEIVVSPAEIVIDKFSGTVLAGDVSITLPGIIPIDQNRVDFYLNGIYQNKDQWSITNGNLIVFSGWSAVIDSVYEVAYSTVPVTVVAELFGTALPGIIPIDQNRVDFYLNGVYQNKDQWSITNGNLIVFSGWSAVIDSVYEIVYIPDTTTLLTIQKSEKYLINISAGQTAINIPGGYTPGIGALAVRINGINQAPTEWTENFTNYITLTTAPIIDSIVEITVTRPDPTLTVSILYVQAPNKMIGDLDRPQISNEDHQRGIVHYAAHLALSKEGKMTQDLQKSQIHLARFEEVVEAIASLTKPQIDISPYVQMPFKV